MILNFICKDVNFKNEAQIAVFEKSNKTSQSKPTAVVGKTIITGTGISIVISNQDKFNTYAIGEEYNFDIMSGKIDKLNGLEQLEKAKQ